MTSTKIGIGVVAILSVITIGYYITQEKDDGQKEDVAQAPPVQPKTGGVTGGSALTQLAQADSTDELKDVIDQYQPIGSSGDDSDVTADTSASDTTTDVAAGGDDGSDAEMSDTSTTAVADGRSATSQLLDRLNAATGRKAAEEETTDEASTIDTSTDESETSGVIETTNIDEEATTTATETTALTSESRDVPATYAIEEGDTLSGVAYKFYGKAKYWGAIQEANPTVDSSRLQIGQKIKLPAYDSVVKPEKTVAERVFADAPSGPGDVHTVGENDSLWTIAQLYYDNGRLWQKIYEANKSVIGADPNVLPQGMKLRIPPKPASDDAG